MSNPWREDIETWEELLLGREYTVDSFFDKLNHPSQSAMALYPVILRKQNTIGPDMDVPVYNHEEEDIRLPEENVTLMMDALDSIAAKEDGRHLNKPSSKRAGTDYKASHITAKQYSDYTIDVLEE